MNEKKKIVVAMSGGVDSSTAAGLLVEQGHEVIGLAMRTHTLAAKSNRACCTPDDLRDARQVADILGIPFYALDYADTFAREVIEPFAQAYRAGRTPNPCVACNDRVKFRTLLQQAQLLGADRLATGHYARIVEQDGTCRLARAKDRNKDQAYFLYRLGHEQLAQVLFPVGEMDKAAVRAHAVRMGLPVATKPESQEICFVGPEGYAATIEKMAPVALAAGVRNRIVDSTGRELGTHAGVHHFTLGQRRGLGLGGANPLYVTDIDADTGIVQVGPRAELLGPDVALDDVVWPHVPPAVGATVLIQRRHRGTPEAAVLTAVGSDGTAELTLAKPAPRAAPGQAAVLFDGDVVLGGGTVRRQRQALPILAG